ncbi:hypothetical protein Tco_0752614 [Tanacetum coccineum]|uniref:Integrase, catalytic region, zinc finger, CCHC-type, peptidase aspartic, catalytic n=1 Tax=Tanacetum coccineum TaxID=301880 RepID=A0ABQ4ZAY1_9ASTR
MLFTMPSWKQVNPPYKFKWTKKTVPVAEGSSETTTKGYMENYKNVSQDIRNQLDAKAKVVQIILIGIDNDIYSIVDACLNACEMFVMLVKQSQELKTVSYHKLYDILKQHQNKVNEIRAERLAHHNKLLLEIEKAIVNSPLPTYDQEPTMVTEDDEMSKEKEIDKLMALISLSFKKIYKPTNNNLKTSSNTSRAHQDNTLRINRGTGYDNQRVVNVVGARENVGTQVVQQSGIQCYNCKEYGACSKGMSETETGKGCSLSQGEDVVELEAHYLYMAKIQEVTPDVADNSRPIIDTDLLQKEQGDTNITIDLLDMSTNGETVNQDDDDLAKECNLLASLIEKLKCEIDDSKNRNKFLESSKKALIDKLKGEFEDFKTKNKSLESSNNHFKEANNELSKTNQLMFKYLKKFQAKLNRYHDVNYASKVEIDCAKAKGDLMSYKMESQKSLNEHTRKINDLNQTISEIKNELFAHQETISIMSQEKEAQNKFYKTREDKEIEKVIALENKSQDLKAQLQDKDIAISELKKLIEKMKRKYVETKFEKPSVIQQPNAFKSQRQSVLGKPTTFLDSLAKTDFSKSKSVTTNNVSNDFSNPVNAHILPQNVKLILKNTNVIAPGVYKVHTNPNQTRTPQLPQDIRKTNKRVSFSTEVISTTSVSRPQLKSNQLEDRVMHNNSQGKKQQVEDHRMNFKFSNNKMSITACNDSLNAKTSNGTVKFRNDQIAPILGYRGLVQRNVTIKRVYYVEDLNHNLFSVGQFCETDLEIAFRKSTCYILDLKGNDLLIGFCGADLYSITLQDTSTPNPICLMAKAC